MPDGAANEAGIQFPSTHSGKPYIAVFKHRGNGARQHKSVWHNDIPPVFEYNIFCAADNSGWECKAGHLWGFHDAAQTVLGTQGQRLAKFPCPQNVGGSWHGYPISTMDYEPSDQPPDELVEKWVAEGTLNRTTGRRIQRNKL